MSGVFGIHAYTHWANCGIGSTVTAEDIQEMTTPFGSFRNVTRLTHTLLALDADKATVEMARGPEDGASPHLKHTFELPAHPEPEEEHHSSWSSEDGTENVEVSSVSFDRIFEGTTPRETDETLDVAGRSLPCRKIVYEATHDGRPISIAQWISDQVPGGVVRMEGRMDAGHVTTMRVISFEKKNA
jgi:hypothetical protein